MNMNMKRIVMAAALVLLPVLPASAAETDTSSLEELAAQLATTPEQHQVVAAYFRGKAVEARKGADTHRAMARGYTQGNYKRKEIMKDHCERLIASFEAIAKEYDELAEAHEQAAKP